jgi:hypothetical protein
MKNILKIIRRLFLKDEGLNLIHKVTIYPSRLKGNRLDCRMDENKPYMLIAFDYISEPETDERIIRAVEDEFQDLPEFKDMEIRPVREILTTRREITTTFKERISLS